MGLTARGEQVLCRDAYLDHRPPPDDQEDTFVGTFRSHGHRTLQEDRSTSSHSRIQTFRVRTLQEDRGVTHHVNTTVHTAFRF